MLVLKLLSWGLILQATAFAAAPVRAGYPLCDVPLFVGEVPGRPFTAPFILLPAKVETDADRQAIPALALEPSLVARDSTGQVMVKKANGRVRDESGRERQNWRVTICYPADAALTTMMYLEDSSGAT